MLLFDYSNDFIYKSVFLINFYLEIRKIKK